MWIISIKLYEKLSMSNDLIIKKKKKKKILIKYINIVIDIVFFNSVRPVHIIYNVSERTIRTIVFHLAMVLSLLRITVSDYTFCLTVLSVLLNGFCLCWNVEFRRSIDRLPKGHFLKLKKSLKISKWSSQAFNRRRIDNFAMAKRKRTHNDLQNTTQKTKDWATWNPPRRY